MDFTTLFFILLSIVMIGYLTYTISTQKRVHILQELFFIIVYGFVLFIFLFPKSLRLIESTLGISSAINFIVYLSIFVAYFILFILYKKSEEQRVNITKLVREIAHLKAKKKK